MCGFESSLRFCMLLMKNAHYSTLIILSITDSWKRGSIKAQSWSLMETTWSVFFFPVTWLLWKLNNKIKNSQPMQCCTSNIRYYLYLSIHYTGRILATPEVSLIGGSEMTPRADK